MGPWSVATQRTVRLLELVDFALYDLLDKFTLTPQLKNGHIIGIQANVCF